MSRPVLWELHIQPMFRLVDRDHMLLLSSSQRRIDLFDYDQVVARCRTGVFQQWLKGHMPPVNVGGPWPEEWLALFDRWVSEGYRRLDTAAAEYSAGVNGGSVLLIATGEKPADEDEVWFERLSSAESPREYALVREAIGTTSDPSDFTVRERFVAAPGVTIVVVHDANGRHEVTIE
jgi:hypothetical protein